MTTAGGGAQSLAALLRSSRGGTGYRDRRARDQLIEQLRERQILFLRFGQDLTQTEIAARAGVSQMQVSRLLRSSLQRLRELTENEPRR